MRGIGDLGVNCPRDVKQIIHLDCPGAWCGGGVGEESSKRRKKGLLRLFCGWGGSGVGRGVCLLLCYCLFLDKETSRTSAEANTK
jgi:hypothetical protein